MQSDNLSPIVLFVYNRPWHTQKTIEALLKNELASESKLFIYADGAKNEKARDQVSQVRSYIKEVDGFKKVTIIERDKNLGLANSIIDGVTQIVNLHGRIIVMEDDIVTSPYFLKFMNEALEFYKDEKKVWHISGWNYPISALGLDDVFSWRLMNCWGWATWADKWVFFEKNTNKLVSEFSKEQIRYLNLDGSYDAWSQVILNKENKINTWAIFWYAVIVKNRGLCVNPVETFVSNIGLDGSGVHCGSSGFLKNKIKQVKRNVRFKAMSVENNLALSRIKLYYKSAKKNIFYRVIGKIYRILKRLIYAR